MTITSEKAQWAIALLDKGELLHADIARTVGVSRQYVQQLSERKKKRAELVFRSGVLVALREAKGWSIRTLAKTIGIAPSEVSRWESGMHTPRLKRIKQLANLFGVEPKKFVTEKIS